MFRVWRAGCRGLGLRFRVYRALGCSEFGVQGVGGFRVEGLGSREV